MGLRTRTHSLPA